MRAPFAFIALVMSLPLIMILSVRGEDYVIDEDAENRARAKQLHDLGIEMAMAGNEADALFDLEEATELDPTNAGYFSDLGVCQMRLGLLDEALNTFMTADELGPGTKLVQDNLKALQEHLDFREQQRSLKQGGQSTISPDGLAEEL
mmetsp:Transcript_65152/g.146957  ORF Transcript_65152/g.146957 Transcript_65152/m.146957 type:complete len:147 (-) Transcript_65152:393-833(-)